MSPIAECKGLWKAYHERSQIGIKDFFLRRGKIRKNGKYLRTWALQNVSFNVQPGEAFAVVGHNGSGKSTLLSLLLGSIQPDLGTIRLPKRIGSLLELGAGFHPDLTGRENVFLYGSILGMSLHETRERFDSIVEFSELGEAVEHPIRTYSAGMIARLGFSIIIHTPAKVLLIDEVLAVGDAQFKEKCFDRLVQFKQQGGSLVIVSHELEQLSKICERGMCIDQGRVVAMGHVNEVLNHYRALVGMGKK
jgi:ABC-2 type transport system ATP-binding protein